MNAVEDGGGVRGLRRPSSSRVLGAAHEASTTYKDDDPAHWRRLGAGRHSLPSTGSSDSLKNIMSIEVPPSLRPRASALRIPPPRFWRRSSVVHVLVFAYIVHVLVLANVVHVLVFASFGGVLQVVVFALTGPIQCFL